MRRRRRRRRHTSNIRRRPRRCRRNRNSEQHASVDRLASDGSAAIDKLNTADDRDQCERELLNSIDNCRQMRLLARGVDEWPISEKY